MKFKIGDEVRLNDDTIKKGKLGIIIDGPFLVEGSNEDHYNVKWIGLKFVRTIEWWRLKLND